MLASRSESSAGPTANMGRVWAGGAEIPAQAKGFLCNDSQNPPERRLGSQPTGEHRHRRPEALSSVSMKEDSGNARPSHP